MKATNSLAFATLAHTLPDAAQVVIKYCKNNLWHGEYYAGEVGALRKSDLFLFRLRYMRVTAIFAENNTLIIGVDLA